MKSALFIKKLSICFCAVLLSFSLWGQNNYTIEWLNDDDGLPQNSVKSIFKDVYGYIWLSTENGLVRYDGKDFKIFNSKNISGISSNRMWFFEGSPIKDSIFTINSALDLLMIKERKVRTIADSLHIMSKKRAETKIPFYFNYTAMLAGIYEMHLHDLYQNFYFENGLFKVDIDTIYEKDLEGNIKYTYKHNFVDRTHYFIQDKTLHQFIPGKKLYRFQQGYVDRLQIESTISKNAKVYTNYVAQQVFLYDRSNLFLIDSIDKNKIYKTPIIEGFALEDHAISSILYDETNKQVYLGSFTKGVGIVKKTYFNAIRTDVGRNNNVEYALAKLNDSTFITGSGTVIQNDSIIATNDFSEVSNKYHITIDKNGDLWTKINNKLFLLKNKGNYNFTVANEWAYDEKTTISLLQPKDKNHLWIATVQLADGKGKIYQINIDNPDEPKQIIATEFNITSLIEIDENSMYIGSKGGLYLLKNYTTQNPVIEKIEENIDVRGFYKDGPNFWVTTYDRSFLLIKDNQLISFPSDSNNFLISAHCIVEDNSNYFWIPTNKGLFKVAKDNLYDYAYGKTKEVYYQYFDKSYGFLNNEFNGGCYPCGITLKNQKIYFPSLSGIVGFSPSKTNRKFIERGIHIDEVEIDGQKQFIKDSLQVDRSFDRIKFYISSPSYEHRYNSKIEVQLKSNTNTLDWTTLGADQTISYTNLPPGNYTFSARKLSGIDSDYQYKNITLIIPFAFWQTLWFKLLLVFCGILMIFLFVYLRIRYVENKNIQLEKEISLRTRDLRLNIEKLKTAEFSLKKQVWFQKGLINSISHDLKTPIKYLALTSKYVAETKSHKTDDEKENLELIRHSSKQMLDYIDKLIIYAKANLNEINPSTERFDLHQIIEECRSLFKLTLSIKNNTIENLIPKNTIIESNKQLLKIIVQNFTDNAIKNTSKGTITFTFEEKNNKQTLCITDTGIGIPKQKLEKYQKLLKNDINKDIVENTGLGLKMIAQLLPFIQASATIINLEKKGVRVTLTINKTLKN